MAAKVLIVEDEKDIAELIRYTVERMGDHAPNRPCPNSSGRNGRPRTC